MGQGDESGRAQVAINLRRLRHAQGLSQEALAARAGVHRTFVGQIERAESNVSVDSLDRLARALEVPVGRLFSAHEPMGTDVDGR